MNDDAQFFEMVKHRYDEGTMMLCQQALADQRIVQDPGVPVDYDAILQIARVTERVMTPSPNYARAYET